MKLYVFIEKHLGSLAIIGLSTVLAVSAISRMGFDLQNLSTAVIGDTRDAVTETWGVYQGMSNLLHRPFDPGYAPIFYGEDNAFAYTPSLYGISIVALPFYFLTDNPILVQNSYLIATFVLSAWAIYLLVQYLFRAPTPVAVLAGLMYGFSQYRYAQLTPTMVHVSQLSTQYLALGLYCLHRFIDSQKLKWAVGFAIAFALAMMSGGYIAIMLGIAGSVILIYVWVRYNEVFSARFVGNLFLAGVVALILIFPFIAIRLGNPAASRGHPFDQLKEFSAPLEGLFSGSSQIYRNVTPFLGEGAAFIGFTPIVLALLAWKQRRSPGAEKTDNDPEGVLSSRDAVIVYSIVVAAGYVLCVGPVLQAGGKDVAPMPFLILMQIPALGELRAVGRFILLATTGTAVLSAYLLTHVQSFYKQRIYWSILGMAAVLLTIEFAPPTTHLGYDPSILEDANAGQSFLETVHIKEDIPINLWLAEQPSGTPVMHYPMSADHDLFYYRYLHLHNQPMLNGGGVTYAPEWYVHYDWEKFPNTEMLVFLKERGISYLLVYHNLLSDEESAAFTQRLQQVQNEWDGIVFVDRLDEVEIYDIASAELVDPSARVWYFGELAEYIRYDFDILVPLESGWSGLEVADNVTFVWSAEETTSVLKLPPLIVESDFIIRFRGDITDSCGLARDKRQRILKVD